MHVYGQRVTFAGTWRQCHNLDICRVSVPNGIATVIFNSPDGALEPRARQIGWDAVVSDTTTTLLR